MIMKFTAQYPSPLGLLTIASDGNSITGLWMETQRYFPEPATSIDGSQLPVVMQTVQWLDCYFAGVNTLPPLPPLAPEGSVFQRRVWELLQTIPYGETRTYGQIAAQLPSESNFARAVGTAVGKNPIAILIPCHRVICADGKIGGYAGGVHRKAYLLNIEKNFD